MSPESRRAARAAAEQQQAAQAATVEPDESTNKKKKKVARTIWLVVAAALVLLLAAACWVGFKAITVKNGLEQSQAAVKALQTDGADVNATLAQISEPAAEAAKAASDPVWAVFEFIPVAGDNLRGVRLAAQSLDALVNNVALPVMAASDSGQQLLPTLLAVAQAESPRISALADGILEVQGSPALIDQVQGGVDLVAEVTGVAAPALEMLPGLLGAEGARNYLLAFQNNAESQALGGSAAAQTLVNVNSGAISMGTQGNSGSYQNNLAVDVPVDQSAIDLYSIYLLDHINTSMSRPDFPTAAQIMRAWWQRDIAPDQIDGVISIDPIALSRVLVATGPVQLPTGDVLDSGNAVSLLLNEVYFRWDSYKEPEIVDGFFAAAAGAVFEKVASGSFDVKDMLWAVSASADAGNILVWSEDVAITEAIAGKRVSGILPTDNSETTTIGAFFQNSNGSKIDYYTKTAVSVDAVCTPESSTFTTTAKVSLPISQEQAEDLPRYVQSMTFGTTFRDWIYVYGPPGTTVVDATVNGRQASVMRTDITDLGRPVVWFEAWFEAGEEVSATATFQGAGDFGAVEVISNPTINPTEFTITDGCAG